jgi:endonuclease/exonuclease/phosphatase family metal-dependent hydrolase
MAAPAASCRDGNGGDPGSSAAVEWRLPAERAERDRLAAWCDAVGEPVYLPRPAAQGGEAVDSLAILTWNTHVGGGDLARLVADLRAGRLTQGQPVEHFVLLLQEVQRAGAEGVLPAVREGDAVPARVEEEPSSGERVDVVDAARELGLSLLYVPSMRNGREAAGEGGEDRGNAILSTLPLSRPRAIELPIEAQRRVALAAVVHGTSAAGPWELVVASAHLDTRSTGSRFWASFGAGRRRQAEALVEGLPANAATVLAGDLNTWSIAALESAADYLRSRYDDTPAAPPGATFEAGLGYGRRLDHMFFGLPDGWTARYRRIDDRYGSDHHPLLGWVAPAGAVHPVLPGAAVSLSR